MISWLGSHLRSEIDQVCVDLCTITVAHSTKNLDGKGPQLVCLANT